MSDPADTEANDAVDATLAAALCAARARLAAQGLAGTVRASVSLRLPGGQGLLFLDGSERPPRPLAVAPANTGAGADPYAPALHAAIYARRADVGAVLIGGGRFGRALVGLGGAIPLAFDEQARHLGRMPPPGLQGQGPGAAPHAALDAALARALAPGGNAALLDGVVACLGTTCQRMVFNAELFEKCATAYVLACATGGPVTTLPWWVCRIATGRLARDQRRAAGRFAQGLLAEDVRGY